MGVFTSLHVHQKREAWICHFRAFTSNMEISSGLSNLPGVVGGYARSRGWRAYGSISSGLMCDCAASDVSAACARVRAQ